MAEATAGSGASRERPILVLDNKPRSRSTVVWDLWRYRDVLYELARTDFQVRYKRAIFGILWAVALPLLQAAVLAFVFSRVIRLAPGAQHGFAVFVLSGVLAWSYFSITVSLGSTAIVDNAELTDKLWFPRSMLPIVPALGGLVGLGVSMVALVVAMPILGVAIGPQVLLLVPACVILVLISIALSLVLASLHVYFRDVRYLVSAALLVWFYLTPILYPPQAASWPGKRSRFQSHDRRLAHLSHSYRGTGQRLAPAVDRLAGDDGGLLGVGARDLPAA